MARSKFNQCVGPSYRFDDTKTASQSAINCYPSKMDGEKWQMDSIPGEVTIATLTGAGRASKNVRGRWFVVVGSTLYEIAESGATVVRGTLLTFSGHVGMDDNQNQLAIVDGANLYIFNLLTNTLTNIVSDAWRGSNNVWELDGYFIFSDPDTQDFYISAIDDGANLNAIDVSNADSSPDNIIAHAVSHRQAWFFGSDSTEIWINSGDAAFPFTRYNSYTIDVGIVGENAFINSADTLVWVGKTERGTGIVYMAAGNQPQRISNTFVERALQKDTVDLSTVTMWVYQIDGHEFIGINAYGLETTLVYDAALKEWSERGEWVDNRWEPLQSRLITHVNKNHYGLTKAGDVVRLDASVNTLSGRVLVRERTWPHIIGEILDPVSYYGMEVSMKTGYGGDVALRLSDDGGANFGAWLLRPLGVIGRRMQRIRWNELGTSFNRIFRIRVSDNVPFTIYSATIDT